MLREKINKIVSARRKEKRVKRLEFAALFLPAVFFIFSIFGLIKLLDSREGRVFIDTSPMTQSGLSLRDKVFNEIQQCQKWIRTDNEERVDLEGLSLIEAAKRINLALKKDRLLIYECKSGNEVKLHYIISEKRAVILEKEGQKHFLPIYDDVVMQKVLSEIFIKTRKAD